MKYHWIPSVGVSSMTEADAAAVQAGDLGHASRDAYEAIERGEYPEWELQVQMMDDHDHPELDFDPLDDTKLWPENEFPPRTVGKMVLNRNSDTQRYRVGPNYLQLPVNSPKYASVATNLRDGQMAYHVDNGGENPHVNYPSWSACAISVTTVPATSRVCR